MARNLGGALLIVGVFGIFALFLSATRLRGGGRNISTGVRKKEPPPKWPTNPGVTWEHHDPDREARRHVSNVMNHTGGYGSGADPAVERSRDDAVKAHDEDHVPEGGASEDEDGIKSHAINIGDLTSIGQIGADDASSNSTSEMLPPLNPEYEAGNTDVSAIEQRAMTNVAIANMLASAQWIKPLTVPSPEKLVWKPGSFRNNTCAAPPREPERAYKFNAPLRQLQHFRELNGYLLFTQGVPIPNSINPTPIMYTEGWYPAKGFGRWDAKWIDKPAAFPPTRSQVTMAESEMYVMVFRDVWFHRGTVMECDRYFAAGGCPGIMEPIKAYEYKEDKSGEVGDQVIAICDRHCKGYYHWTHEQLPRVVLMMDYMRTNPKVKLIIPGKERDHHHIMQTLVGVLGLPTSMIRFMDFRNTVKFHTVYYPQPQRCGSILTPTLILTRKVLFEALGVSGTRTTPTNPKDMLVVMADRNDIRQTANYEQLVSTLATTFPQIRFESHMRRPGTKDKRSVKEQMLVFNQADMVIGPHGANLANIMWCKVHTPIVEYIFAKTGNLCYYQTASKIGLEYRMVMVPGAQDYFKPNVSIPEIVRHVQDVYDRIGRDWKTYQNKGPGHNNDEQEES